MNIQFSLAGTALNSEEALALLESTKGKGSNSVIELERIIDINELDANVLFQTAVATGDQNLASLAWKISVSKKTEPQPVKETPKLTLVTPAKKLQDLDSIIDYLNKTSSYTSTGVAMLLKMSAGKEWFTLRETAIHFANTIFAEDRMLITSKFFRGFEYVDGKLSPIDYNGKIERKKTFHVSPMYIALREGLVYCTRNELLEQVRVLSVGAPYVDQPTPSVQATRRVYYKIRATERGKQLAEMWADLDRYIVRNFAAQIPAKVS
jgi:hypothetical protein